jgi:hypothetical protein
MSQSFEKKEKITLVIKYDKSIIYISLVQLIKKNASYHIFVNLCSNLTLGKKQFF